MTEGYSDVRRATVDFGQTLTHPILKMKQAPESQRFLALNVVNVYASYGMSKKITESLYFFFDIILCCIKE